LNSLRRSNNSSSLLDPKSKSTIIAIVGVIFGASLLGIGCKDELVGPKPATHGTLEIRLANEVPGAFEGGTLTITSPDSVEVITADESLYARDYLDGTAISVLFEKDCTAVSPLGLRNVTIEAGETSSVDWSVNIVGGLTIRSNPEGAAISLDGTDTGRVTPTTFECQGVGQYEISLSMLGTVDRLETIDLPAEGADLSYDLDLVEQTRGAFVEVLTATECPNCLPVDLAAENIWQDAKLLGKRAITVQQHHPWAQGIDVFHTQDTWDRNALYDAGDGSAGHPIRMVNGLGRYQGAGDGDVDRLTAEITEEIGDYIDMPGTFAMHWSEPERIEGQQVSAKLRIFVTSDVVDAANTAILSMNYKNNLFTFVRIHQLNEEFYRVVRNIDNAGSCADLGLLKRGDFIDLEFVFDTSWDTEWHEVGMGMVALAQNLLTKEVLHVTHTPLP